MEVRRQVFHGGWVFSVHCSLFSPEGKNTDSGSDRISSVSLLCGRSEEGRGRQRGGSERIFSVFLNREKFFEDVRSKKRIFRVPRWKINWNFFHFRIQQIYGKFEWNSCWWVLNRELLRWSVGPCLLGLIQVITVVGVLLMKLYSSWSGFCFTGFLFLFLQWTH
jgi:hypothetical protein